jgi:hypothetical protein
MHKVPFTSWLVNFEAEKPVKRFLRKRNVLTMLAVAGLMLSIAALVVVVGLGEAQIAAAEGKTADLFGRPLFDLGLFVAGVGILIGTIAISANSSQAAALSEFPDLAITVLARGAVDTEEPGEAPLGGHSIRLVYIRLRIFNREAARNANLSITLLWPFLPATLAAMGAMGQEIDSAACAPAPWEPRSSSLAELGLNAIKMLPPDLQVPPRTITEGDLFFPFETQRFADLDPARTPCVEVVDHDSGEYVKVQHEYHGAT